MSHFGDMLRTQMERKKLTGQQLSAKIGLSQTSVSKILKGHSKPRQSTLARIVQTLCDTPGEESLLVNTYSGVSFDTPEEVIAESSSNYQVDQNRIAQCMDIRTQAMSFKNAIASTLIENNFSFHRDYCESNFSIDFLVRVNEYKIALELMFNTSRGLEKAIALAQRFQANTKSTETIVVVPYIDHVVEAISETHPANIEIIPLQEIVSKLETFKPEEVRA